MDDHLGYGECRTPLFLKYVQADIPITVNIWMKNFAPESNLEANLYTFNINMLSENAFGN